MQSFDIVVESEISASSRCRQLEGMFDVPPSQKSRLQFTGSLDLDAEPWQIGLIVGPSGCGKSTIARHLWLCEYEYSPQWNAGSVIDNKDIFRKLARTKHLWRTLRYNPAIDGTGVPCH